MAQKVDENVNCVNLHLRRVKLESTFIQEYLASVQKLWI